MDSDRKSQDCLEQTISRIIDINDSANKVSEGSGEHGRENLNHKETVSRNMKVKDTAIQGSEGNKIMLLETRRKESLVLYSGRKFGGIVSYSYAGNRICKL